VEDDPSSSVDVSSSGDVGTVSNTNDAVEHDDGVDDTTTTTTTPTNNTSWYYDPLLNIMIVLLFTICYLLVQKFIDLSEELLELQAMEYSTLVQDGGGGDAVADDVAATTNGEL
jgi:hypothetical protein